MFIYLPFFSFHLSFRVLTHVSSHPYIKMSADTIILEIDNTPIVCDKQALIRNSDYFRAMLEGEFVEKDKEIIKLEGVDLRALKIIMTLLADDSYSVDDEDILVVLQVACMLQFVQISRLALNKVTEILCPKNCLKIWMVTEQHSLRPICFKAKSIALDEFMVIKDTECVQELTLEQICSYVGHVNLRTDDELFVFRTVMKWWIENCKQYEQDSTNPLLKLLSCVDYKNLSDEHFNEILSHPAIVNNDFLKETFLCLYNLKTGLSIAEFSEVSQRNSHMLFSARSRILPGCPCFLVHKEKNKELEMKRKLQAHFGLTLNNCHCQVVQLESYTEGCCCDTTMPSDSEENFKREDLIPEFHVLYYDQSSNTLKKYFDIENSKCRNLEGFAMIGYKECILLFGGQYKIGRGSWNYNFWMYDPFKNKWMRKTVLSDPRRHFESCITDGKIFILGGAGNFRVTQGNLCWYNIEEDSWSNSVPLPFGDKQLKCCEFLNKYFVLSLHDRCGYFFTKDESGNWIWLIRKLVADDAILNSEAIFELASYRDRLYIKGKKLIEFALVGDQLVMQSVKPITRVDYDGLSVTVCDNSIYTLYKVDNLDNMLYSFEKYDLATEQIEYIFRDVQNVLEIEGRRYQIHSNIQLFSSKHYSLIRNELINYSFL